MTGQSTKLSINITPQDLEQFNISADESAPEAVYYAATLQILGVDHHLCIFPIHTDEETGAQSTHPALSQWLDGMQLIDGPAPYQTITIKGKHCVALVTPYCR